MSLQCQPRVPRPSCGLELSVSADWRGAELHCKAGFRAFSRVSRWPWPVVAAVEPADAEWRPEAASAFADPLSMTIADPDHSADEERWVLLGFSYLNRLVVVAHVERGGNIRLISARLATPAERKAYEEVD